MHDSRKYSIFILLIAMTATGCTGNQPLTSRLDESTGLTVVAMNAPITLARPTRLAVAARDYAYLGPVEINRMGDRKHYLWVGLATTLDRARDTDAPSQATMLVLSVDGVPMALPLTGWDTDLEVPPYAGSTPVYASLAARTSVDQIDRIAAADSVIAHIITASGDTLSYRVWGGDWPGWRAFATAARR